MHAPDHVPHGCAIYGQGGVFVRGSRLPARLAPGAAVIGRHCCSALPFLKAPPPHATAADPGIDSPLPSLSLLRGRRAAICKEFFWGAEVI